jgi:hypothetical protein
MIRHIIALAALVAAFVFLAPVVWAHKWYDYVCCSDRDCYPLPDDALLEEQSNGDYLVKWISPLSGRIIEGRVTRQNVRDTQDPTGKIHGCERSDGLPRCIYILRGV